MKNNLLQPRYSRGKSAQRRSVYVAARVSERTRHALDVLSLIHRESFSSLIERGIEAITGDRLEFGGATEAGTFDDDGVESTTNLVRETWAADEWLRRLKLSIAAPQLLTPTEAAFWRRILVDTHRYWGSSAPCELDGMDLEWLQSRVTMKGTPDCKAISDAWNEFAASNRVREDSSAGRSTR